MAAALPAGGSGDPAGVAVAFGGKSACLWIRQVSKAIAARRDSRVLQALGLGEAPGEFIRVVGGDQLPLGGVIAWRQCPVVPGGLAAPNPPPRVLAPQPVKSAVPVVRAVAGGHR